MRQESNLVRSVKHTAEDFKTPDSKDAISTPDIANNNTAYSSDVIDMGISSTGVEK